MNQRKDLPKEYKQNYFKKQPWVKNWYSSVSRARLKGWKHTMTKDEFKELWFRDKAYKFTVPSIDRIDPTKGYIQGNCRFLERNENSHYGSLGKPVSQKSREMISSTLKKFWVKKNKHLNKDSIYKNQKMCCWCGKYTGSAGRAIRKEPNILYCPKCYAMKEEIKGFKIWTELHPEIIPKIRRSFKWYYFKKWLKNLQSNSTKQ